MSGNRRKATVEKEASLIIHFVSRRRIPHSAGHPPPRRNAMTLTDKQSPHYLVPAVPPRLTVTVPNKLEQETGVGIIRRGQRVPRQFGCIELETVATVKIAGGNILPRLNRHTSAIRRRKILRYHRAENVVAMILKRSKDRSVRWFPWRQLPAGTGVWPDAARTLSWRAPQ